jgi:hypothetical protein
VAGLRNVKLIGGGNLMETKSFVAAPHTARAGFSAKPAGDTWYSLVVEDVDGRRAFSDPVWVTVATR